MVVVRRVGIVLGIEKEGRSSLSEGRSRVRHLVQLWEARMDAMRERDCVVGLGGELVSWWGGGVSRGAMMSVR